jgi:hypothetical protein
VFTLQTEYHPAGHECLQAWRGGQELRYRRACFQQPLEVVQYEKQLPLPQVLLQRFSYALSRALLDLEGLSDGRWDQGGVANGGECNEAYTVLESVQALPCYLKAQPSLADSAGTRERQQTYVGMQQPLAHLLQFSLATDERSEL